MVHRHRYFHKSVMVADIQTDLHNYSCNNSGSEEMVDVIVAVVHLNSHSVMMDIAWDYSNQDRMMKQPLDIDSDWRSFDRMDYLNPSGMNCNSLTAGLHNDKDVSLDVFVSR